MMFLLDQDSTQRQAAHQLTPLISTSRFDQSIATHTRYSSSSRLLHQTIGPGGDGVALNATLQTDLPTLPSVNQHVIRQAKSAPRLSQKLSHKLSTTFIHPTIVHRPELKSRPSVQSIQSEADRAKQIPRLLTNPDSSDPASPQTSGSSNAAPKGSPSTAPTSLSSVSASATSVLARPKCSSEPANVMKAKDIPVLEAAPKLTCIEEAPVHEGPSIVTAEQSACTKIFLETVYNTMFSKDSGGRSVRQWELEQRLRNASVEERVVEYRKWQRRESDYLRRVRVMKIQALHQGKGENLTVAGYSVIKVLGKGSFGVVRLVREKDEIHTASIPAQQVVETPKERPTALIALRTFGVRRVTRRKEANARKPRVYAMKVIRKSDMLRNSQEGHLRAERDFLVASEGSKWIVSLISSFQDYSNLYLVMDFMIGGDFLGLLVRKQILSEAHTRFYIAEMILCIEEAHKMNWIHRDIKPDNFLISSSGHLKISDFGLAFDGHWTHDQNYFNAQRQSLIEKLDIQIVSDQKDVDVDRERDNANQLGEMMTGQKAKSVLSGDERYRIFEKRSGDVLKWRNRLGRRKLAKSIVGTSQYMAPEVIRGEYYDGRCDWWSVGIILYECLFGFTPFCCETRQKTKKRILHHRTELMYPISPPVTNEAFDLIERLLQEQERRLCSVRYMSNDFLFSQNSNNPVKAAKKNDPNYRGRHVYSDGASDIKTHPFFRGIDWRTLHQQPAPWIPRVKGRDDTRYFEDDEYPISDIDDEATATCPDHSAVGNEICGEMYGNDAADTLEDAKKGRQEEKEKRRARDRILRDPNVGHQVLEIRKKSAFLGYNYLCPQGKENQVIGSSATTF
ncbi:MAG: hypothetical protein M1814_003771 [Vezdaea aestivalis]|nr:MAG: hypothetical protein M1814_003771 [Vezdaea aestivalis]